MSDWRIEVVGTCTDAYGEEVEVCVEWNAAAEAAEEGAEPRVCIRGDGDIQLDQEGAEQFARLFVSACWEAARKGAEVTS